MNAETSPLDPNFQPSPATVGLILAGVSPSTGGKRGLEILPISLGNCKLCGNISIILVF